jgi:metal-responsive CopG/Arc/MetJ family transcriptional regulator
MQRGKRLLITLDSNLYDEVKEKSVKTMGRQNVSGLINVLLKKYISETE